MRLRRIATMGAVVALTVAGGASLPGSSAYLNGSSGAPSSFGVGAFGEQGSLVDVAHAALCGVRPETPCPVPPVDFIPPWLAPSVPVAPAPVQAQPEPQPEPEPGERTSPRPSPSSPPRSLPEPGERCETPECVEAAVHVVGAFADELQQLQQQEPEGMPEEAVRIIAEYAEDLRELPEAPEQDMPLPEETLDALGALVEAGVLEAFTPECVVNVGQLAALLSDRQAAAENGEPTPEPSPTATCEPSPREASPEPTPEPEPAPQAQPQPGTEPEEAPTGEPTEYPHDGPGHRVRSA